MIEVTAVLVFSAFIAGILMFLAPCTLPLVPAYLAFISGVKPSELQDKKTTKSARRSIIFNSISFVIGFSLVFISFGMVAGFFGSLVGQLRAVLIQVGGVFIILFGLMMLNIIPFQSIFKSQGLPTPKIFTPGNPMAAFLIGTTFALGWTPCVGPILASVLLLATTKATVISGGLLLAVFSLGLAIPFLLVAFLFSHANKVIPQMQVVSKWITVIGGLFLILVGVLILSDNFGLVVQYGYRVFEIIGADRLFDYL